MMDLIAKMAIVGGIVQYEYKQNFAFPVNI
jgi:hypothetical protein